MDLLGVHHVSINVSDLPTTVAFYRDVLGLELLDRPDDEISVEGAWFGMPDGRELHLLLTDVPENRGQHFAFEVADVEGVVAALADQGIEASRPKTMTGICSQTFCTDPSGNLLEFNQRL